MYVILVRIENSVVFAILDITIRGGYKQITYKIRLSSAFALALNFLQEYYSR